MGLTGWFYSAPNKPGVVTPEAEAAPTTAEPAPDDLPTRETNQSHSEPEVPQSLSSADISSPPTHHAAFSESIRPNELPPNGEGHGVRSQPQTLVEPPVVVPPPTQPTSLIIPSLPALVDGVLVDSHTQGAPQSSSHPSVPPVSNSPAGTTASDEPLPEPEGTEPPAPPTGRQSWFGFWSSAPAPASAPLSASSSPTAPPITSSPPPQTSSQTHSFSPAHVSGPEPIPLPSPESVPQTETPLAEPDTADSTSPVPGLPLTEHPNDSPASTSPGQPPACEPSTPTSPERSTPNPLTGTLPVSSSVWRYLFSGSSRLMTQGPRSVSNRPPPGLITYTGSNPQNRNPSASTGTSEAPGAPESVSTTPSTPIPIQTMAKANGSSGRLQGPRRSSSGTPESLPAVAKLGSSSPSTAVQYSSAHQGGHNSKPYAASISSRKSSASLRSHALYSLRAITGQEGDVTPPLSTPGREDSSGAHTPMGVSRPSTPHQGGSPDTFTMDQDPPPANPAQAPLPVATKPTLRPAGSFFSLRRKKPAADPFTTDNLTKRRSVGPETFAPRQESTPAPSAPSTPVHKTTPPLARTNNHSPVPRPSPVQTTTVQSTSSREAPRPSAGTGSVSSRRSSLAPSSTTPRKNTAPSLLTTVSHSPKVNGTTAVATVSGTSTTNATAATASAEALATGPNYVFPTPADLNRVISAQRQHWADHLVLCHQDQSEGNSDAAESHSPTRTLWNSVVHTLGHYLHPWVAPPPRISPDGSIQAPSDRRHSFAVGGPGSPFSASPPVSAGTRRSLDGCHPVPDTKSLPRLNPWLSESPEWQKPMKNVVIIGVHGWFPMKFLNKIIGEPTGTSSKFCEKMYEGLITYLKDKQATLERTCNHCGHCIDLSELSTTGSSSYSEGLDIDPDFYTDSDHESDGTERDSATASDPYSLVNHLESVSLIPLVGEGKIEDRVNALWDQLVESDMAFQHQAMRTIPLVRRAWHQDPDGDLVWLPATVRAQIQIQQVSKQSRRVVSTTTRSATDPGVASPTLGSTPDSGSTAVAASSGEPFMRFPAPGAGALPTPRDHRPSPLEPTASHSRSGSTVGDDPSKAGPSLKRPRRSPPTTKRLLCPKCHCSTIILRQDSSYSQHRDIFHTQRSSDRKQTPRISMMPWLPALYQADTVLIATHSQGTPVSTLLLDRLITQGLVNPQRQRVGMLAMAGISHGPFSYLRDNVVVKYFEAEAARELFTLASPDSPVSVKFRQAMDRALNAGVKVVTVGSMVDQVVPLYSSIVHGLSHMNVYRAIYIDGAHFSGDFLTDLLIFAIKLRNYGLRDHDLVVHISEIIAGSLYTGTPGHSTIYNDAQVYETAARWVMESIPSSHLADPTAASAGFFQKWATFRSRFPTRETLVAPIRAKVHDLLGHSNGASQPTEPTMNQSEPIRPADDTPPGTTPDPKDADPAPSTPSSFQDFQLESRNNPYYLPWIMRGLLEDPLILNHPELGPDLAILKQKFLQWNPMQKNLRDLKFRLEPLRASL
ncbi:hypothetical protein H4R33_002324 [Dimargaris cristalligena]|nr:hypothetical protein H4R33_002324 [Dimargaris cristalligena]